MMQPAKSHIWQSLSHLRLGEIFKKEMLLPDLKKGPFKWSYNVSRGCPVRSPQRTGLLKVT